MKGGTIFSLDLATKTGWCEGAPGGRPISGSLLLAPKGASQEERFLGLFKFLWGRFAFDPGLVCYEAPLPARAFKSDDTAGLLLGLPAIVGLAAEMKGIRGNRLCKANVGDVRTHFLGTGYRTRGKAEPKKQVIARCRELGFAPVDDNEADAIALWHYACACVAPKTAHVTTPLFQGAVA